VTEQIAVARDEDAARAGARDAAAAEFSGSMYAVRIKFDTAKQAYTTAADMLRARRGEAQAAGDAKVRAAEEFAKTKAERKLRTRPRQTLNLPLLLASA